MCLAQGPQRSDAGEARTRGLTVQDADLLQNRKFRQIGSNLFSTCSSRPN